MATTTTTTTVIPDGTYNPGTFTLPQQSVAAGEVASVTAQVTILNVPAGTNFEYDLFVSYDGGTTWDTPSVAKCAGGINSKTGQLSNWSQSVDTQFRGPALWYVQVSFQKRITVQNVTATVDLTS